MSPPNPHARPTDDRERDIFLDALEQTMPTDRAAYLDRACGGDAGLRSAVEALLRNHKADAFLETPVVESPRLAGPTGTALVARPTEKPGDRIGYYRLLQEIGEGACGTVYMADQEAPVRRRVALKIIKPGMDSKAVIARFEAERQAVAMMDHPNIAKVFDAGTTETGRPYFVMELVRGIRITEYCDQNQLATRDRLDLFIKVCNAIQHAHQKGIIHRDIKPSNILVTLHDGVPVPKIIDFGIAKAIEQRLTDKTVFTQFQAFIGTPAYTSPEQAEMSGLDIDTRSDIYSLGVLLYELLTGQTPFDPQRLLESGLDEMRRIIREDEPLRPSTRMSTMGMADATALSRTRRAGVSMLVQAVRGDLDWIVMRCLEKDRTRRYATANALATDIERFLNSEPVSARPPSTAYRLQKFVSRNRVMVTAASAVALVMLVALILSSWLAFRASRAEREQSRLRREERSARKSEEEQRLRAEHERLTASRSAYTSDMNLVQQALAANNYGRVIDLLNRHRPKEKSETRNPKPEVPGANVGQGTAEELQPDFRQWEWRYFWNQSRSEAAFALPTQTNTIAAIALSPNGRLLLVGDRSGTIKLWDVTARTVVAVLRKQGQGFGPSTFAFSRDGSRVAVAVNRGPRESTVRIWTVATRQFTTELPQDGGTELLAFSVDDSKLLTFGQDAAIRTWDLATQKLVARVQAPALERRVRRPVVFSPDVQWLAIAQAGRVQVLSVQTGEVRASFDSGDNELSLAISPDGETLAAGPSFMGGSFSIKLFSLSSSNELGDLVGHVSWVPALIFTPDGKRLVSAGADQSVRIWDLEKRQELAALRGHLSEVNAVAVTPDGQTVMSGCKDGTLFGWDLQHLSHKEPFETLPVQVTSIEFFRDSQSMLSVNGDGAVSLWNPATLVEKERITALGSNVTRILLSPDNSRLYAGTRQGTIKVLDWATRLVITNLVGVGEHPRFGPHGPGGPGSGQLGPIALTDSGRTLVTAGVGGTIRLLDTSTWQTQAEWKLGEGPGFFASQLAVSPDEHLLVVAGSTAVEVRDLLTGQTNATLPSQTWGVSGIAFAPNASLLATSSGDGTVNLWNSARHELIDVLRGHLLGVHGVAFSPDGERLATVSHGNEAVKLWDVITHHEVATLVGQGAIFNHVKFSPDGRLIIAVNMQRTAYVWRAPSREDIAAWETQRARLSSSR